MVAAPPRRRAGHLNSKAVRRGVAATRQSDAQKLPPEIADVISLVAEILLAQKRRQLTAPQSTPATGRETDREAA